MLTREDVLRIRSIEEAFDLSTTRVRKREVALIRVASREDLIELTVHAAEEADDEMIPHAAVWSVIEQTKLTSKDVDPSGERHIGVNFDGAIPDGRSIRAKITWDDGYLVVTVHTIGMVS